MITYREHRGSFDESMKTRKEFSNVGEIMKSILTSGVLVGINDIILEYTYYCYDERTNENLYTVRCKGIGILGFIGTAPGEKGVITLLGELEP